MKKSYSNPGDYLADQYNEAWRLAYEQTKDDPELCVISDIESGYPVIMTLTERQKLIDILEACEPKGDHKLAGKVWIFGTGGEINKNQDFNKMWSDITDLR